jgi:hypothetical protein
MPLRTPNLDDRTFEDLIQEAKNRIAQTCPQWTDLTPGDPGMVLLDAFAYLTDIMLYRLNRVPVKMKIAFLRLMGVNLLPPAAAHVELRFALSQVQSRPVEIPSGTRVTVQRSASGPDPPVFTIARTVKIEPGHTEVDVPAHHCELVEAEPAGVGNGRPGQAVVASRPPITSATGHELDLVVAVEATEGEIDERAPSREYNGKVYRIWQEVENFTDCGADACVFVADRMTGTITFAPALQVKEAHGQLDPALRPIAQVPRAKADIRLWYRRGGGPEGNVAANTLTVLKDPIPGVRVTNPQAAMGGRAAETLENALIRGPHELHSLKRAVTARDYELVAGRLGSVARAKAFTQARRWKHAAPGTVEVVLVPRVSGDRSEERVTLATLKEHQTEQTRAEVQRAIDERRPLGTRCLVNWVRYKVVTVNARAFVYPEEDPAAVKARIEQRLHQTVNPLSRLSFGEPLRASHLYDIALSEPGVRYVDSVSLRVDEAPSEKVVSLAADAFQPRTWYAGSGCVLFRSQDDGDGWEPIRRFPEEESFYQVAVHPQKGGCVAVVTSLGDKTSRVYVSEDCGQTWRSKPLALGFKVQNLAWMLQDTMPVLLLATDRGLYRVSSGSADPEPVQVLVVPDDPDRGFYAVAVSTSVRGAVSVAVASQRLGGVFLSSDGGHPGTFRQIGLADQDIRVLAAQRVGPRAFLWAGLAAAGGAPGTGCHRWELRETGDSPEGWRQYDRKWRGGSCHDLGFAGWTVLAATHRAGVLRLDAGKEDAAWEAPQIDCGLPLRDVEQLLHPVDTTAVGSAASEGAEGRLLLAAGPCGVYRSYDLGTHFEHCSAKEFGEKVTLPETWLFCSGEHEIDVVSEP